MEFAPASQLKAFYRICRTMFQEEMEGQGGHRYTSELRMRRWVRDRGAPVEKAAGEKQCSPL